MSMKNFTNPGDTNSGNNSGNSGNNPGNGPGGVMGGMPVSMGMDIGGSVDPLDLLINYNKQFAQAGATLFRDDVIQQTLSVLIGKNKPNALLVGPAGVGKTKIV